jgi:hypothetical protein
MADRTFVIVGASLTGAKADPDVPLDDLLAPSRSAS